MIKLKSILNQESIDYPLLKVNDEQSFIEVFDEMLLSVRQMGLSSFTLWRGIKATNYGFLHIKQDRKGEWFRGKNVGSKEIIRLLGIEDPIFAHFKPSLTPLFGNTFLIVLKNPYKIFQSPVVDDIMAYVRSEIYDEPGKGYRTQIGNRTQQEILQLAKSAADTYVELKDGKPLPGKENREVVIDVKEYWAIDKDWIIKSGGKFMPKEELKTYGDVFKVFTAYRKFQLWKFNNPKK